MMTEIGMNGSPQLSHLNQFCVTILGDDHIQSMMSIPRIGSNELVSEHRISYHCFSSRCCVSTIQDPHLLTFLIGVLCISLAVVELGIGGSVFNFVSGYYFFDGSVYIFGSWWSVLLVLVGDSKLK